MMRAAFVSCFVADAMSILKIIIIRCLPAIGKFSIYMCGVEQYGCCGVVQVPEVDRGGEGGRPLIYLIVILNRNWQGFIEEAGSPVSTDSYEEVFNATEEIRFLGKLEAHMIAFCGVGDVLSRKPVR